MDTQLEPQSFLERILTVLKKQFPEAYIENHKHAPYPGEQIELNAIEEGALLFDIETNRYGATYFSVQCYLPYDKVQRTKEEQAYETGKEARKAILLVEQYCHENNIKFNPNIWVNQPNVLEPQQQEKLNSEVNKIAEKFNLQIGTTTMNSNDRELEHGNKSDQGFQLR